MKLPWPFLHWIYGESLLREASMFYVSQGACNREESAQGMIGRKAVAIHLND